MLNAILQLEAQGECRESATEAVLIVGYTSEGISNQKQTRWLSWNKDGGVRGFDLARNPGLSNNTEYDTSKPLSMIRSQQKKEAYPDLSSLKRELERHRGNATRRTLTGMVRSSRGTRLTWKEIKRSSRGIRRGTIST